MTLPFYTEMAQLVIEMLGEFGVDMELKRTDPESGTVATMMVRGVFVDPVSYRLHPVELNPVDKRIIVDSRIELKPTDRLSANGFTWILTRVDAIRPADLVIGYKAEMRNG